MALIRGQSSRFSPTCCVTVTVSRFMIWFEFLGDVAQEATSIVIDDNGGRLCTHMIIICLVA